MDKTFSLFSGNSNPELAKEISTYLKMPLGKVELKKFSDDNN